MPNSNISDEIFWSIFEQAFIDVINTANKTQLMIDNYISKQSISITKKDLMKMIFSNESTLLTGVTNAFNKVIDNNLNGIMNNAWGLGTITYNTDSYPKDTQYKWLIDSDNPCPDCLGRSGRIESLDIWLTIGLPRSGFSICDNYCRWQFYQFNK